jgi:cell division septum initiation protein DivIVA
MDAGTLKDYLEDVINERNNLLREIERLKKRISELLLTLDLPWEE